MNKKGYILNYFFSNFITPANIIIPIGNNTILLTIE